MSFPITRNIKYSTDDGSQAAALYQTQNFTIPSNILFDTLNVPKFNINSKIEIAFSASQIFVIYDDYSEEISKTKRTIIKIIHRY